MPPRPGGASSLEAVGRERGSGRGIGEVSGDVAAHGHPGRLRRSDDGGDLAGQLDEMIQVGGDVLSGGAPQPHDQVHRDGGQSGQS